MDAGEIRKLVRLMEEAGLTELEVEDRSGKIRLVRGAVGGRSRGSAGDEDLARNDANDSAPVEVGRSRARASDAEEPDDRIPPGMTAITSPMVGTFYRASAPDEAPFVSPGDVVQPGQVVCIIEAMKMMNEVCAETAARIVSVQAENGAPVEYGSPLFVVELLE